MIGYPCCCDTGSDTAVCSACVDSIAALEYQVVIADVVDYGSPFCSDDCADLNATYILTRVSDCIYEYDFADICDFVKIHLEIQDSGSATRVKVQLVRTGGETVDFTYTYGDYVDCTTISGLNIPSDATYENPFRRGECQFYISTSPHSSATVTAL